MRKAWFWDGSPKEFEGNWQEKAILGTQGGKKIPSIEICM